MASACDGSFSSSSSARLISARFSVASSTNTARYLAMSRGTLLPLLQHLAQGRDHRVGLEGLHDEVLGARLQRLLDQRLLAQRAAHHHARLRIQLDDALHGVDT